VVIVGPCSIHDPVAALEYARRLARVAHDLDDDLYVVMRTYFEKPRTTLGWKGLINDPGMDETFLVNDGILSARQLLVDILALGLPVGGEFVDPLAAPFLADAMSWGAVGARTSQSPVHRQLASALPMPVGFKNGTGGDIGVAIDAVLAAAVPQVTLGIGDEGGAAVFDTEGNPDGHVVLRGGTGGPNFDGGTVARTRSRLAGSGLAPGVIIDASHANSGKDHREQAAVAGRVADAVAGAEPGFAGLMLESFLVPGRQSPVPGRLSAMTFGQSVTDECMGWDTTTTTLERLARAVVRRRAATSNRGPVNCGAA
jgi:3-deoxy-7-phosphoheptulonate synthase